ncbi:hypothetical protein Ahy_A01g001569 isoform C [Arachis hypogaea]|uniref:UBP-type domain-containing protein n=1 Tax=Arachis hypogaea TaxID=3818 RepID=A0A445ENZ4_ARAHY|nr:hypothetical protein Ahy_A01g001569 isoform C [Arachis hypogaea]
MKELKLGEYLDENAALSGTVDFDEHLLPQHNTRTRKQEQWRKSGGAGAGGKALSTSWCSSTAISSPPILIPIPIPIPNEEPSSFFTSVFSFSSENPRIEETRGLMHLFPDQDPLSTLPFGRKPFVCVVGVPNYMTYATSTSSVVPSFTTSFRCALMGGTEDQYSILICFNDQGSTDSLFKHYNGRRFSSMEVEVCCVLFTLDVQYTGSVEHAQPSNATSTEQPTCPVCLESLDQDTPVEFSLLYVIIPFIVRAYQNRLILLVLCAAIANNKLKNPYVLFVGTLRTFGYVLYAGLLAVEGHAIMHSKETQHCYALDMETKHVWDFVGDNYVHRLIQSKTDRKLVELNTHCVHAENGCGSCSCEDNSMSEALLNSKVEVIINEYNELLATQLENQKSYFESLLQEVKEETERKISKAVQKAVSLKQQKIQAKIDRCNKEKKFLEELRYLMTCLDDAKPEQQQLPEHNEIKDGLLSASSKESSSTTNSQLGKNP